MTAKLTSATLSRSLSSSTSQATFCEVAGLLEAPKPGKNQSSGKEVKSRFSGNSESKSKIGQK